MSFVGPLLIVQAEERGQCFMFCLGHTYALLHTVDSITKRRTLHFAVISQDLTRPYFIAADLLGERLENEGEGRYRDNANLCYICSGSVDKFVECW